VNTTCRGIELKHLLWRDVDLFERQISVGRSKTPAKKRTIPLNDDALGALIKLRQRAETLGSTDPDHFVFPACERQNINPRKPQKTWRTAWRSLIKATAARASEIAAKHAQDAGISEPEARKRAAEPFLRFRFHDLRHQAITEMAENGAPDATVMALAGHLSREMMEHYSHVRMAAKRKAVDALSGGLIRSMDRDQVRSDLLN
jgi:integrase